MFLYTCYKKANNYLIKPTLNRDGGHELPKIYDSLLATSIVLGHHQRPEVKDHPSVIIQLPSTEDGVGYSEIFGSKKWVLMTSFKLFLSYLIPVTLCIYTTYTGTNNTICLPIMNFGLLTKVIIHIFPYHTSLSVQNPWALLAQKTLFTVHSFRNKAMGWVAMAETARTMPMLQIWLSVCTPVAVALHSSPKSCFNIKHSGSFFFFFFFFYEGRAGQRRGREKNYLLRPKILFFCVWKWRSSIFWTIATLFHGT